jgi:hypothetical protein
MHRYHTYPRQFGHIALASLTLALLLVLAGCGGATPAQQEADESAPTADSASDGSGTLEFYANGEDFVRQGFVTSDGWSISFDHVYVTLADITAYQSDPPFESEAGGEPQAEVTTSLDETYTVDLAEGDADADPILIASTTAPAGRYNALSWRMVPASEGTAASDAVVVLQGTAEKEGESVPFTIHIGHERMLQCGDYVGDERKGILEADGTAALEATFHFDHLFGDGEAAPDDDINTGSLGFDPFFALAEGGTVDVTMADLEENLPPEELEKLEQLHMEHVGEGHCAAEHTHAQ